MEQYTYKLRTLKKFSSMMPNEEKVGKSKEGTFFE